MEINLLHILLLSAVLFGLGLVCVVVKRHAIMVLMGIELIFNAANLNLVAFARYQPNLVEGQTFALFVIVIAAAEAAVALAIIQQAYRAFQTASVSSLDSLHG
jgi:NADH:ubiquinone oxidoreductase subunit K